MITITIDSKIRVTGLPERLSLAAVRDCTMKNPEYATRRRLGKWLGGVEPTITLAGYAEDALILPRGYLERLVVRIQNAGLEYHVKDRRLLLPEVPEIDIEFNGTLRPYQARALTSMTAHGSGILVAPCGSGKTALLAALIAHCRRPSLVLVHTRQLAEQTRKAVKRWLDVAPGLIGDGVFDVQPVTVGIVQSLAGNAERVEAVRNRFGLVALDEAHHSPAATFTEVLQQFPADFRYGVTATPDRRDGLGPFIELVIGPVRHTVTAEELHDDGILVVPEIVWLKTDFRCFADEWVDLISALVTNERRNHFILEAVLRLIDDGRRIIALSERVNHVEALADAINRSRPGAAVVVTGSMGRKKSDAAMSRIMSGEARVLLSTKLADEGLDIPDLNALVLLTPTRNGGRTIQRAGRILRAVSGKSQPVIYDIVDPLVGILWSQARTRFLEAYKNIAPGCNLPEWLERSKRQVA